MAAPFWEWVGVAEGESAFPDQKYPLFLPHYLCSPYPFLFSTSPAETKRRGDFSFPLFFFYFSSSVLQDLLNEVSIYSRPWLWTQVNKVWPPPPQSPPPPPSSPLPQTAQRRLLFSSTFFGKQWCLLKSEEKEEKFSKSLYWLLFTIRSHWRYCP